jgi:hypothetical protein
MIHLFIDTNVLLSFYAFTPDDLTRLERLAGEVEAGRFVNLTTSHVRNEFLRNRENKIAEARKAFQSRRLDEEFPRLVDQYEETKRLRELAGEYSDLHDRLLRRIDEDARDGTLMADQLIDRFLAGATTLEVTQEVIDRARLRRELGNPPGKRGSIGDAVNWELLLDFLPPDHLFYVTNDSDFYSPLGGDQPLEFLTFEWEAIVSQPIGFVRRLSQLPEEEVPHEILPVEDALDDARDDLVAYLQDSGSFAQTHRLIQALRQFPSFTPKQVSGLVAALANDQVGWIAGDDDVFDFYTLLMRTHSHLLADAERRVLLATLLVSEEEAAESSDLPF